MLHDCACCPNGFRCNAQQSSSREMVTLTLIRQCMHCSPAGRIDRLHGTGEHTVLLVIYTCQANEITYRACHSGINFALLLRISELHILARRAFRILIKLDGLYAEMLSTTSESENRG